MRKILSVSLFFLHLSISAFAVDFYVSTSGNNANPGTQALPWRTIQQACNTAVPGSTVYIMAGTYHEQISTNVSGTSDNYITFTHFEDDVVTIDGGGSSAVLWTIKDQRYISIIELKFANAIGNYSTGIVVRGNAEYINLLNNEIYNIHFSSNPAAPVTPNTNVNPLIIYGNSLSPINNITVVGNYIHNCRTGYSEGLTVNGNVYNFSINYNTIHDITNIGIDIAGGYGVCPAPENDFAHDGWVTDNIVYNCISNVAVAAGIYADGSQSVIIERNYVHDCGRGLEVGCENPGIIANNITVRNNVAWHNREAGIGIGGYDYPATGKVTNSKIHNNTFYDNCKSNNGDGELLIEYTENCIIENNIFYATNPANFLLVTRLNSISLALQYNLYYHSTAGATGAKVDWNGIIYTGFQDYQTTTGQDVNSIFGNPLFTNAPTNFLLNTGSPAYNAGDPAFQHASAETDIYGENRVLLGRVDIGAVEANVALPVEYLAPLSGYAVPKSGIALQWSTASEYNAVRFEVERSTEGTGFEKIAEVAAHGNSQQIQHYDFLDEKPAVGINNYRLRQIDGNYKTSLSNIVAITYKNLNFNVLPNPVSDFFEIKSDTEWEYALLRDTRGEMVRKFSFSDRTSLAGLAQGLYSLEIFTKNNAMPIVFRVIKQ